LPCHFFAWFQNREYFKVKGKRKKEKGKSLMFKV
jgi:hypothetical protein